MKCTISKNAMSNVSEWPVKDCSNQETCCQECGYEDCSAGCEIFDETENCEICEFCEVIMRREDG